MNIDLLIQKLTLEEKAALLQGWSTWTSREIRHLGIPAIFMSDGPTGLRKQAGAGDHLGLNESVPATCFPTAATMANSWDLELGEQLGSALGTEAAAEGVHVVLGPGLNMKRSPLCGRNFEYFSEDPYLAGKMAAAYVKGIQSKGPAACPKHFAVNSQELRRMAMDSLLDERTLREIYLTGFEIAVQEGHAQTLMSSYNMVNGEYANENYHLLTEILRNEWGFDGYVVTDWGGDNDHTEGVRNGSNLVMPAPGPDCAIGLVENVKNGKISEENLDIRVKELMKVVFERTEAVAASPNSFDADAHHAIARKCAEGSIVLLDNDGILPLAPNESVAVIGDFAETPRYQGAGSSQVNPTRLDDLLSCAKAAGLNVREGGLFFLFSNLVTVIQYVIYAFLPEALGLELAGIQWSWPAIPVKLFGIDFTWNAIGYDVLYDAAGNVIIGGGVGYLIAMLVGSFLAQAINFPLQRNITFRSNGNVWYQMMWYFIAWVAITFVVNSFNCVWLAVASQLLPGWLYNIGTTVLMGGISMIVFFFVFKIIFPEGKKA